MIKKIAIASVAVLTLAGCASNNKAEDPAPVVTVTEQAPIYVDPPVTDSYVSVDDEYLYALHDMEDSYIENTPDSDLLDIGNATCEALDSGVTISELVFSLASSDTFETAEQAQAGGIIIAAAASILCPQHASQVQDFLTENS